MISKDIPYTFLNYYLLLLLVECYCIFIELQSKATHANTTGCH